MKPYRTRSTSDPPLETWRPRIPVAFLRVWRSKRFRHHASAWGFSLSFNTGGHALIWALLGRVTEPGPLFSWKITILLFFGGLLLLRIAWAFFKVAERER